jgi:putative ABC transport system substrate-binding protein
MNTRRKLVVALGAGALASQRMSFAQEQAKGRRIGVLMGMAENDAEAPFRLAAFKERLTALGWVVGRNLKLDVRWTAADPNRASMFAKELVALQPDVILVTTTPATAALQRETRTVPIVFTLVSDPVGSGFVETLARPGGNITGFINIESGLAEKWVQMLKEIAPRVTRVAVMFNPDAAPYAEYYLRPIREVTSRLRMKAYVAAVRSESDIEVAIRDLGREPGGGLIDLTNSFSFLHRKLIFALAARYEIPAIYSVGQFVEEGGLISYGVEVRELFRRAASYVDRILRGARPGELPVQQPETFELFINLKTAKTLGIKIPETLLVQATKVFE